LREVGIRRRLLEVRVDFAGTERFFVEVTPATFLFDLFPLAKALVLGITVLVELFFLFWRSARWASASQPSSPPDSLFPL